MVRYMTLLIFTFFVRTISCLYLNLSIEIRVLVLKKEKWVNGLLQTLVLIHCVLSHYKVLRTIFVRRQCHLALILRLMYQYCVSYGIDMAMLLRILGP